MCDSLHEEKERFEGKEKKKSDAQSVYKARNTHYVPEQVLS